MKAQRNRPIKTANKYVLDPGKALKYVIEFLLMMFSAEKYIARRARLCADVQGGLILLPGNMVLNQYAFAGLALSQL